MGADSSATLALPVRLYNTSSASLRELEQILAEIEKLLIAESGRPDYRLADYFDALLEDDAPDVDLPGLVRPGRFRRRIQSGAEHLRRPT